MTDHKNKPKRPGPSANAKRYLIAYNLIQAFGWHYMLIQTILHFYHGGSLDTFWSEIKLTVVIFQNAAILEVVHAAIGLVPSGAFLVFMQVYSRMFLVCGALLMSKGATTSPGLPLCILAWSITEVIRYGYYAANLLNKMNHRLLFLRYSTFLVLYPVGITGELLCMYHSLEEVAEKQLLTYSLPNSWNFVFNYYYFLIFYMLLYLPLFPVLFGHMLAQRKKMLGGDAKKTN